MNYTLLYSLYSFLLTSFQLYLKHFTFNKPIKKRNNSIITQEIIKVHNFILIIFIPAKIAKNVFLYLSLTRIFKNSEASLKLLTSTKIPNDKRKIIQLHRILVMKCNSNITFNVFCEVFHLNAGKKKKKDSSYTHFDATVKETFTFTDITSGYI